MRIARCWPALDVVFSIDAMVHVDLQYVAAYWLSAAKLLRPGGKIIMSVADATREKGHNRLVQDTPSLFPLQGQQSTKFQWLCQELVQSVLRRLGFDVIDAMPDSDRDFFFVATKRS
jgi:cyclopropane fatty-acyl-phospholipid synthase-like methyltransferase